MNQENLCDEVGSNTGALKCDTRRGRPVIMAYGGKVFSRAETATEAAFRAAFKAAMVLPNGDSNKLYPIPENVGINDQTAAPKTSTLGSYGPDVVLVSGRGVYEFDLAIGITLEKTLGKLNGEIVPFFIWDDKKNTWGCDDGNEGFAGVDCVVNVIPKPFEDGKDARVTKFKISMVNHSQFSDDALYVPSKSFKGSDFKGLNDVFLRIGDSNELGTKYRIFTEMKTSAAGVVLNIFDEFKGSALGLLSSGLWKAKSGLTDLTVTGVSILETAVAGVGAVAGVRATGSRTMTVLGADGDTIFLSMSGTPIMPTVTKTGAESTLALLATKVADAITGAVGTNGGYTASAAGAVVNILAPLSLGATVNGTTPSATVTGAVVSTGVAFSGGVTAVAGTGAIDAGKGFLITIDDTEVGALDTGDIIEIYVDNVTALQAANVKGIEVVNTVEYTMV